MTQPSWLVRAAALAFGPFVFVVQGSTAKAAPYDNTANSGIDPLDWGQPLSI